MQNSQRRTERKNRNSKIQDKDVVALRLKRTDVLKNVATVNSKEHLVLYVSYITAQSKKMHNCIVHTVSNMTNEWMNNGIQYSSWWTKTCSKFKRGLFLCQVSSPCVCLVFFFRFSSFLAVQNMHVKKNWQYKANQYNYFSEMLNRFFSFYLRMFQIMHTLIVNQS